MLKHGFKQMLAEANAMIESVSVQDLDYLTDDPEVVLVDVRETVEREMDGAIPGSIHVSRGMLEFRADPESPTYEAALDPQSRLILYSGSGGRSALAAMTLLKMGFADVATLAGGYEAWRAAKE